jgi:diaminopimelate epimerase
MMRFTKMHGLGNDFIIMKDTQPVKPEDYHDLAIKLCDRYFGVGADGLIITGRDPEYDIYMRIINSDGSEPEMCGNGIRCLAKYAWEKRLVQKTSISVRTLAGPMYPELSIEDGKVVQVKVDMGMPILKAADIPVLTSNETAEREKLSISGQEFEFTGVSMGNPHCVIMVEDLAVVPVKEWGPQIEVHACFPRKTNVEFVQVLNRNEMKMQVWERGAGETLACGTGACATLVAGVITGKTDRKGVVHLRGGDLLIEWSQDNGHVYMTGPAQVVFEGEITD